MMEKKLAVERAYQEAFGFCEEVRSKLCSSDYQFAFLRHLYHYNIGEISIVELKETVAKEISQFPDLVDMFNHLLERCEDIGRFLAREETEKSSGNKNEQEEKEIKHNTKRIERRGKSVQNSDLSKCTAGYRLSSVDCHTGQTTQRWQIRAHQVLKHERAALVSMEQKMKVMKQKKLAIKRVYQEAFCFSMQVRDKLSSSDDYFAFLKHLHDCSIGKIDITELKEMVGKEIAKFPDLVNQFDYLLELYGDMGRFLAQEEAEMLSSGNGKEEENKHNEKRRKEEEKSIQDTKPSQRQFVTPSYHLVPKDCSVDKTSETLEICDQLLNDELICVRPDGRPFKDGEANEYEEVLFKCEDDQYKVDMLLNSFKSAEECVEELLKEIKENKISLETPFHVFDHLSILNKRCIEKMCYKQGRRGYHLLVKLCKEPLVALPIILNCLKRTVEEVTKLKSESKKKWAKAFRINHQKSIGKVRY